MPLISKPNYNQIFASQAPDQDKPAVFNNYPEGWGPESRPNNGKPTIKGFNYLQQASDLKDLWILQNGACLPYDESIEYAEGAPVLKDGVIQYKTASGFKSRDSVTVPTYKTAADGVDPVTGVADGAYFNVRSTDEDTILVEYQNVGGVPTPSGKSYPSAGYVRNIAKYTALPFADGKTYTLNARVMLDNGDIVKNTVAGNTTNPNIDMMGWVNGAELQMIHNKSSATFTDFLTSNEISNKSTTNLAAKLQAINDLGGVSKLRIPKGDWLINSAVTFTRDFEFDMDPDAYLKFGLNGSITFTGSATLIGKPTANISNDSRTIQLANSLQSGDLICIYSPNNFSFSPLKAEYRNGEFLKVATASASSITTYGRPYENYASESVDIYKINPIKIGFNRFNVKAENAAVNDPVSFVFCEGLSLTGYSNVGSKSKGFILDRCYNVTLFDFRAKNNSALVGLNYGIIIQNCQNIRVYGGDNNGARHSITTGGGGDVCAVPCREIFIENAILKTSNTAGISAADFHANISDSRFRGCVLDHATIGGKNISIEDSTVFSRDIDGTAIIVGGVVGGYFNFTNCTLVLNSDISSSRGAIDVIFEHDLVEDVVFNFNNIKLTGSSVTNYATLKFLAADGVSISKKVTINIPCYDSQLTDQGAVLRVNGSDVQNIIPNLEINIGHVTTKKKGIYYVQATNTITAPSTKLSLPAQKGSTTITASDNTTGFILGNTVTLDYFYPIVPSVVHSVGTDGTWNPDGANYGMKPVTSMLHTNSNTAARFALICPTAIPDNTYKISYNVGM